MRDDENTQRAGHAATIAGELGLRAGQVEAVADLLSGGATVPFIARYRKERTGSLDEVAVAAIRDRLAALAALDERRETILRSLEEREILTDELRDLIAGADTLARLEDVYLPFRPKRRTRASVARERGLEPLAESILAHRDDPRFDPAAAARSFVDPSGEPPTVEEALAGARDIIAERVSEDAEVRRRMRELFRRSAVLASRVIKGKEEAGATWRDWFDWREAAAGAPSHRVLAMFRGEREKALSIHVLPDDEAALAIVERRWAGGRSPAADQAREAARDAWKRLIAPSMENETRRWLKERADRTAIDVFAANLRELLMEPPLGRRRVMAIDPGFRTGCKVVCLDPQGALVHRETIFPHTGEKRAEEAAARVRALVGKYSPETIAVGNGTAGRETERFLKGLDLGGEIDIVFVNESGASIYSASEAAREEFPDEDVTVRGAVSIGRRLMDPLAELVKIDPKSIGVGQYQHDVDQPLLRAALDDVVVSCVNTVGVEVNTASARLLSYVSGLGAGLAAGIVSWRESNGPFASRADLRNVPRLGPKAFEQSAGFLRVRGGLHPLDATAVHPESYKVVERMAADRSCAVADLVGNDSLRKEMDLSRYVDGETGLPTLEDILDELARPGRDPRAAFEPFSFAEGVETIEDLREGMRLPGIVTNVTAFGAFVDVGVHQDGLGHVSKLANRFVRDPAEVVRVGQRVTVTVLGVDLDRRRVSLSMREG